RPGAMEQAMIDFTCPGCGAKGQVPDEAAGKKAKCPRCGSTAVIPPTLPPRSDTVSMPPPLPPIPNPPTVGGVVGRRLSHRGTIGVVFAVLIVCGGSVLARLSWPRSSPEQEHRDLVRGAEAEEPDLGLEEEVVLRRLGGMTPPEQQTVLRLARKIR